MTTPNTLDHDEQRAAHDRERRVQLIGDAQRLDAELSVLSMYDDARRSLGFDFGNGQRHSQIVRARRERDFAITQAHAYGYGMGIGHLSARPEQVRDAYRRIALAKMRRYEREPHVSRTQQLALLAWQAVGREVERVLFGRVTS